MKKKILAVMAALAVATVMMLGGTASAFANDAVTADIEVSLQMGNKFLVQHKTLNVKSTLSDEYGYSDEIAADKGVSAIDALIAMHIDYYNTTDKSMINEKLTTNVTGAVKMLGEGGDTQYTGFSVNEKYAFQEGSTTMGASIFQAKLSDGDSVEYFWYEDQNWMDTVTVFTHDGNKTKNLSVKADTDFTIAVEGFVYMNGYSNPDNEAIENAVICTVNDDGEAIPMAAGADNYIKTDKDGKAVLNLSEGTYILTAIQGDKETGAKLIMPWCEVTVTADKDTDKDADKDTDKDKDEDRNTEPAAGSSDNDNSQGGSTADKTSGSGFAETGDDSDMTVFVIIAAAAVVCGGAAVLTRRRVR